MMMNYSSVITVIGKKIEKINWFVDLTLFRAYHMDCLNPPLNEPPPGAWYCQLCVGVNI